MTKDDIIRMAREAGVAIPVHHGKVALPVSVWRFAEILLAAEREACAKLCESIAETRWPDDYGPEAEHCASAIRARGLE